MCKIKIKKSKTCSEVRPYLGLSIGTTRADLIRAVGPFKITVAQTKTFLERTAGKSQLWPASQREVIERRQQKIIIVSFCYLSTCYLHCGLLFNKKGGKTLKRARCWSRYNPLLFWNMSLLILLSKYKVKIYSKTATPMYVQAYWYCLILLRTYTVI